MWYRLLPAWVAVSAVVLCGSPGALAQSGGGFDLSWGVLSGGGVTFSTGANFSLGSTVGQPVAFGASPSHGGGNFHLSDGFWFVRYAALSGVVNLLDFTGDPATVAVQLEVRAPGSLTPLQVHTLSLSGAGTYTLVAPLDGDYDLSAKASRWLRHTLRNVSVRREGTASFTLANGDVDGDNEVTTQDFAAVLAAFGTSPGDARWNPSADLDGDEEVTLADFVALVRNFGAMGDD